MVGSLIKVDIETSKGEFPLLHLFSMTFEAALLDVMHLTQVGRRAGGPSRPSSRCPHTPRPVIAAIAELERNLIIDTIDQLDEIASIRFS